VRRPPMRALGAALVLVTLVGFCNALAMRRARAATVFSNYNGLDCSCGYSGGFYAEAFSPTGDFDFTGAAASIQNEFPENHSFSMALYSATASGVPDSPLWTSGTVTVGPLASTLAFAAYGGPPILLQAGTEYFLVLDLPTPINPLWIADGLSFGPAFSSTDGSSWESIGQQNNQFEIFGTAPGSAPIPEPATWTLLLIGFGVAGLVSYRRRLCTGLADPEKTPRRRFRTLLRPIFDPEPRHAPEFARVEGHERCTAPARLRGNQRVARSDRLAARFEESADFAGLARVLDVESGLTESGGQEKLKRAARLLTALALGAAIFEFEHDNGRNDHRRSGGKFAIKPLNNSRLALVEREDHDIGVETIHSFSRTKSRRRARWAARRQATPRAGTLSRRRRPTPRATPQRRTSPFQAAPG